MAFSVNYDCIRKTGKVFYCLGALLLFLLAVLRFAQLDFTNTQFVIYVYYIGFGILIILIEMELGKVLDNFYFMRWAWGKGGFATFIATLCFNLDYWIQIMVWIFFACASIFFFVIGCCYFSEEKERIPSPHRENAATSGRLPATI